MSWRLVAGGIALFVLIVVVGAMVGTERIAAPIPTATAELASSDVLNAMKYSAADRRGNLEKMGFDSRQITLALDLFEKWSLRYHVNEPDRAIIPKMLDKSEDRPHLVTAFCGRASELPPRYSALPYLVDADGPHRVVLDLDSMGELEEHDWAADINLVQLYRVVEDAADRKSDATRMLLAGILAGREVDVLNHVAPWGNSLLNPWSWDRVKKDTGVEDALLKYVVNWHLVMEAARQPEGGLCTT